MHPFEEFEAFFDGVADSVRDELSFFLLALDDDSPVGTDEGLDCEKTARAIFRAETHAGRIGELIRAAATFDVYFAADLSERFAADKPVSQVAPRNEDFAFSDRYADRLRLIEVAREEWQALRRTTLSPAAIAAALVAVPPQPKFRYPRKLRRLPTFGNSQISRDV